MWCFNMWLTILSLSNDKDFQINAKRLASMPRLTSVSKWRLVMAPPTCRRVHLLAMPCKVLLLLMLLPEMVPHAPILQQHIVQLLQWDQQPATIHLMLWQTNTIRWRLKCWDLVLLFCIWLLSHKTSNIFRSNHPRQSGNILRWVSLFCDCILYKLVYRPEHMLFTLQ